MTRRVLVTGSRSWTDVAAIADALTEQDGLDGHVPTLVYGACPSGADHIAEYLAAELGWHLEPHPADWDGQGRSAGFRRNAEMVATKPDVCLAFVRGRSGGATHCADTAEAAGIPTKRWTA